MMFDPRQKQELVEAFTKAFTGHRSLASFVERAFGENLNAITAETNALPAAVDDLMGWAARRGRLLELFHKARLETPGNAALRGFAARHLTGYISSDMINELEKLVSEARPTERHLHLAYARSAPPEWLLPPGALGERVEHLCSRIIWSLSEAPVRSDRVPLVEFALILGALVGGDELCNRIRDWGVRVGSRLGVANPSTASEAPAVGEVFLVVMVSPRTPRRYALQMWIAERRGEGFSWSCELTEDEPRVLDDIQSALDQKRGELAERLNAASAVTVEFFLPRTLLCAAIEAWRVRYARRPIPIGVKYKLVIRSLERFENSDADTFAEWTRKWERLHDDRRPPAEKKVVWLHDLDKVQCDALYTELLGAEVVGVALTTPPPPPVADHYEDLLMTLIDAGIPVAVWPQSRLNDPVSARGRLETLLDPSALRDLPQGVFLERRQSVGVENCLARCLALLWDDPKRLPPRGCVLTPPPRVKPGAEP